MPPAKYEFSGTYSLKNSFSISCVPIQQQRERLAHADVVERLPCAC